MKQVPLENLMPRQRRECILRFRHAWRLRRLAAVVGRAARTRRSDHVAQHISRQPLRHVARKGCPSTSERPPLITNTVSPCRPNETHFRFWQRGWGDGAGRGFGALHGILKNIDEGFIWRRGPGIMRASMWCEAIVRNAAEDKDFAGRAVEYVDIRWDQCRSTLKARSRGGEEVRVLLPRGQTLQHGDVLFEDETRAVVINVLPCEVAVVRSAEPRLMAELALELGNLHWPTEVTETELIFLEGEEATSAAHGLGLEVTLETRRFDPLPVLAMAVRSPQAIQVLRSSNSPTAQ